MSLRHPSRASATPRWGIAGLVLAVALLIAAGCGSSSGPSSGEAADAAARAVSEAFRLPDEARTCLTTGFEGSGTARDAISGTGEPTATEQEAVGEVVEACVTDEQVAEAVASSITAALPPPDTGRAAAQTSCLRSSVLELDPTEMRTLLVGLLMLGAPLDGEVATARNDLVNSLYAACGVEVGS